VADSLKIMVHSFFALADSFFISADLAIPTSLPRHIYESVINKYEFVIKKNESGTQKANPPVYFVTDSFFGGGFVKNAC
jgi:hypothetical protein